MSSSVPALSALAVVLVTAVAGAQQPPPPPPPATAPEPPAEAPAPGADGAPPEPSLPTASPGDPPSSELPPGHPPVPALAPDHPSVGPPVGPVHGSTPSDLPPVPAAPPLLFPIELEDDDGEEIVGFQGGRMFIRDPHDVIRLYPGGRLRTDFYSTFVALPDGIRVPASQGGSNARPHLAVRRVRLELSGEIIQRIGFTMGLEMGGARPGETTFAPQGPRFAPARAETGDIRPAEVTVSYRVRPWLGFTVGQTSAPISMSNRTRETTTPFMERPIGITGFAVPENKEIGLTVWGDLPLRMLSYEIGVFGGDGARRPVVDASPDVIGRVYARPLALLGRNRFFTETQVGLSARHGERDQRDVVYDHPAIASNQGYVLWQPGYVDSAGRNTHVIPSGAQNTIGGELRLPVDLPGGRGLDVHAEAYYAVNNTREAVEGFELTNTERFGRVKGVGWYAMVSFWACGDAFVSGEPGVHRPITLDPAASDEPKHGLEVLALFSSVLANYTGASREGSTPDANTPSTDVIVHQIGAGLQYWYTTAFRATLNWMTYWGPDAGDPASNLAYFPSSFARDNRLAGQTDFVTSELMHELGGRLAVSF